MGALHDQFIQQGAQDTANVNLSTGVFSNPDQIAQDAITARRFGVSGDTVAANRDYYSQQAKAADAQVAIEPAPKTTQWVAADPQNAKISHDDTGLLASMEGAIGTLGSQVLTGIGAGVSLVRNLATGNDTVPLRVAERAPEALAKGVVDTASGITSFAGATAKELQHVDLTAPIERRLFGGSVYDLFANQLQKTTQEMQPASTYLTPTSTGNFAGDAAVGAVQGLPGMALAVGGGMLGGAAGLAPRAASLIGAATAGVPAAGNFYKKATDQGVDPDKAYLASLGVGAVNAAGMYAGELPLLKGAEEGAPLLTRFLKSQLGEQVGFGAATVAQNAIEWGTLPENKGKTFSDFLAEQPSALGNEAVQTLLLGGLTNFGMGALERATGSAAARARDEQAARETADQNTQGAQAILQMAANSKTRERDPETFQNFMEAQTQDGPLEHVYVDGQRLNQLLTDAGEDGHQLVRDLPSVQDQLEQAVATGGDVRIPTAELATRLPGSPLEQSIVDNLRVDPLGMSKAEASDSANEAEARLQQSFEEQLASKAGDDEFMASRDRVTANYEDKLGEVNRFTPDVNRQYASLLGNFYAVQASKLGITPEEMAARYPLDVRSTVGDETADEARTAQPNGQPQTLLNIGLARADGQPNNTPQQVLDAIKAHGGDVAESAVHTSATEPTVVARLKAPLSPEAADAVSRDLGQQAIAQRVGDVGDLHGPEADAWKPYNPEYFLEMDGKTAAQNRVGTDALANLPANAVGPMPRAKEAAASYATGAGLAYVPPREYVKVDPARAKRIADAFDAMEHNPQDPATKAAYDAMIAETLKQWEEIKKTGLKVEFITGEDPYGNPRNAILDVRENNHLWVYPTESGFGSGDLDVSDNPLLAKTDETISGRPALANDIFRIVHDYFGHIKEGVGFRADGEENAWRAHSAMYSPLARQAMTTETRGQNSWVNFGPHGEANRKANGADTVYAPQKIGLLPEWVTTDGATDSDVHVLAQREGSTAVRDETTGLPKAVYHGTAFDFGDFKERPRPTWFAEDARLAGTYADARRARRTQGENIRPAYLDIRNPLDLGSPDHIVADPKEFAAAHALDVGDAIEPGQSTAYQVFTHPAFIEAAKKAGYDGIKVGEAGTTTWAPFNVNQIKPLFTADARAFVKPEMEAYAQGARGYLTFGNDITAQPSTIHLLQASDLSTFIHESAHFFLEVMSHMAAQPDAPESIRNDMAATLKYLKFDGDNDKWRGTNINDKRDLHENFARSFEAYAFEGKAPSAELKSVFQRFRSWLVSVYRNNVANLRVNIDPTIRGVFDRMIASTDAIRAAEAEANDMPKFATKPDSMTDVEWQEYQALGDSATAEAIDSLQAASLRDMRFARNAHSRELARLKKEVAGQREQVEAEITNEVAAEPEYRALDFLKRGVVDGEKVDGPTKISLPELEAMYPDKAAYDVVRKALNGMVARENGIHPEQVAEMFGFSSADEMIRKVIATPNRDETIQAATDLRMLERYGDITSPQSLDAAASRAIHNDVRARFVATELRALDKGTGSTRQLAKAAKTYAGQLIRRLKVRDLKPAQYEAAERRAGKNALAAVKAGDTQTAIKETRNQLLNLAATRAARDAEANVNSAVTYFRKFAEPGTRANLDSAYRDQIDAMLERFDFRTVTNKALDRRASLASWIEGQRERGFEPALDPRLVDEAYRTNYRNMTVDELMGLRDSVKNIEHLARLKNRLLKNKEQRDLAVVVDGMVNSIETNAYKNVNMPVGARSWIESIKNGLGAYLVTLRKFSSLTREMDGQKDGGAMWAALSRPMNEATEDEANRQVAVYGRMKEGFDRLKGQNTSRREFEPAIGRSISLEDRLGMASNWGNDLNRQRLMDGHGFTQAQVEAVLSKLDANHWQFVKDRWARVNAHWEEIAAQAKRIDGVEPEKQDPTSFQITGQDGTVHNLPGGYYPIKYDLDKSSHADANSDAEIAKQQMRGAYTASTTRRGFTKDRVERVIGRPMRLDFGVESQHHREVVHDLAWRETLMDVNRLMRKVTPTIRDHYGPNVDRAMRRTITDVAAGNLGAETFGDKVFSYLRSGVSTAGIAWNVWTGVFHLTGGNNAMMRIGPEYYAKGLRRVAGDAAKLESTTKWVESQSEYMALRRVKRGTNIADVTNALKPNMLGFTSASVPGWEAASHALHDSFHVFIDRALLMTSIPTWAGAYEKATDEGHGHNRAVKLADQAVRDSHGSSFTMDRSEVQRSKGVMSLLTSFYMWFNTTYNQLAESVNGVKRVGWQGVPAMAGDFLLFSLSGALVAGLKGFVNGDDWKKISHELAADQVTQYLSLDPFTRQLAPAIGAAVGGTHAFDYKGPPITSVFTDTNDLIKHARQGNDLAMVKDANHLGGIIFHYPAAQVQRTTQGVMALADGKTRNPLVALTGPQVQHKD